MYSGLLEKTRAVWTRILGNSLRTGDCSLIWGQFSKLRIREGTEGLQEGDRINPQLGNAVERQTLLLGNSDWSSQWVVNHMLWNYLVGGWEKAVATHSSVLAWRIPWMEEPGGLLSTGSHRARHDWSDFAAAAAAVEGLREIWTQKRHSIF